MDINPVRSSNRWNSDSFVDTCKNGNILYPRDLSRNGERISGITDIFHDQSHIVAQGTRRSSPIFSAEIQSDAAVFTFVSSFICNLFILSSHSPRNRIRPQNWARFLTSLWIKVGKGMFDADYCCQRLKNSSCGSTVRPYIICSVKQTHCLDTRLLCYRNCWSTFIREGLRDSPMTSDLGRIFNHWEVSCFLASLCYHRSQG